MLKGIRRLRGKTSKKRKFIEEFDEEESNQGRSEVESPKKKKQKMSDFRMSAGLNSSWFHPNLENSRWKIQIFYPHVRAVLGCEFQ